MSWTSGLTGAFSVVNPVGAIGTAFASGVAETMLGQYYNKKNAKTAYERQLQLLDYQNAYNTPAAQMERYKEAGLNPNLIYGQSNLSAGASSVSQAAVPKVNLSSNINAAFDRYYSAIKMGQDLQLGQEQIEQVIENKKLLIEQARVAKANADILEHELGITP